MHVYEQSRVIADGTSFYLVKTDQKYLAIEGDASGFVGEERNGVFYAPLNSQNAATLSARLPWLRPVPLGIQTSAGFGDRLGSATPGHILATQGTGVAPIFAQQSVRENARTGRTPQVVLDDAMWGCFQMGWRDPWGADADHLKTPDVVAPFVAAGYTFFTVDPGDHVDDEAQTADKATLTEKVSALPWDRLESSPEVLMQALGGQSFTLPGLTLEFDETTALRAAAKYGRAVAHAVMMYRHLQSLLGEQDFDFEVSVDETATTTSIHEHFYIAHELKRLGVRWVSLAPRFVGRFEKGVDFIGDLDELDTNLAHHAAVLKHFGGYKLSLHSGSDKFSVYPLATKHSGGMVHLKTAGTSYLEALRVLATHEVALFREIFSFSYDRYDDDRATYHVSAKLAKVPTELSDDELPNLLNLFDARQVLHVTYGSVLDQFGQQLHAAIDRHEAIYHETLRIHFDKHLAPFH